VENEEAVFFQKANDAWQDTVKKMKEDHSAV
jgi:hypothetical protein